jgi:hypothetical protein
MGHRVMIPANSYLPADAGSIPTGAFTPVAGTVFDFRTPRMVGNHVRDASKRMIPASLAETSGTSPTTKGAAITRRRPTRRLTSPSCCRRCSPGRARSTRPSRSPPACGPGIIGMTKRRWTRSRRRRSASPACSASTITAGRKSSPSARVRCSATADWCGARNIQWINLRQLVACRRAAQHRGVQLKLRRRQDPDAHAVGQLEEALHL